MAIYNGRLELLPNSGNQVPADWLAKNRLPIIREILEITSSDGYLYSGYSTGNYEVQPGLRKPGITINFESLVSGRQKHIIFNVDLARQRTTKFGNKGDPLPRGHFRISSRHNLYKFWIDTGLPFPKRLASLCDYMGNLKQQIFACTSVIVDHKNRGRIATRKNIYPLAITTDRLLLGMKNGFVLPDSCRTISRQFPDNSRSILTDKKRGLLQLQRGLEPILGAGLTKCDMSKQGNTYTRSNIFPFSPRTREIQDQTEDEWLSHYGSEN